MAAPHILIVEAPYYTHIAAELAKGAARRGAARVAGWTGCGGRGPGASPAGPDGWLPRSAFS